MGATTKSFDEKIGAFSGLDARAFVLATNTGTSALRVTLIADASVRATKSSRPSFNYVTDHQAALATDAEVVMFACSKASTELHRAAALLSDHNPQPPFANAQTVVDVLITIPEYLVEAAKFDKQLTGSQ
jgi:hypothetical protein